MKAFASEGAGSSLVVVDGLPGTASLVVGPGGSLDTASRACLVAALKELAEALEARDPRYHFRVLGPTQGLVEITAWPKETP